MDEENILLGRLFESIASFNNNADLIMNYEGGQVWQIKKK
jgi:hypothetical protein